MTQLLEKPKRFRWCPVCREEVEVVRVKMPDGARAKNERRCKRCGGKLGRAARRKAPRKVRVGSDAFWTAAADKAVGSWARAKGACEATLFSTATATVLALGPQPAPAPWTWCKGKDPVLQWAHGFGRKAYPATRWDKDNSFCLCRTCHARFSTKPLEWDEFMRWRLGQERYDALRERALRGRQPDPRDVVEAMRGAA